MMRGGRGENRHFLASMCTGFRSESMQWPCWSGVDYMKMAYIISLPPDERRYLEGDFEGGEPNYRRDVVVGDTNLRQASLEFFFQRHIKAPIDFVSRAPNKIIINKKRKFDLDFGVGFDGAALTLVSEKFYYLSDIVAPGQNQFIKIEKTFDKNGFELDNKYYHMNITNVADAIDIENSNVEVHEIIMPQVGAQSPDVIRAIKMKMPFHVVLKRDAINGMHMWQGTGSGLRHIFISDELKSVIEKNKLKYLNYKSVNVA